LLDDANGCVQLVPDLASDRQKLLGNLHKAAKSRFC
jgi:hypothetical protein